MSGKVLVAGVGMIPFGKPGQSPAYNEMGAEAARRALNDAGIRVRSMRTKSNRLEELFVRLTGSTQAAA